jgi:hypothetical protein
LATLAVSQYVLKSFNDYLNERGKVQLSTMAGPPNFLQNKETFNVKLGANKTMTAAQTELNKLEKKVELLSKAMHLLLFEEKETLSKKESKEIEKRLSAYLKGKKNNFVNLEDVTNAGSKNTQKRAKRA